MKKKILFIIQWYPSFRSANVNCDTNIMRELLKTGRYDIHCLVYKPYDRSEFDELDGLKIHRFHRGWLWTTYQRLVLESSSLRYRIVYALFRIATRVRQVLTIPIYPMMEPGLAYKYAKKAIKLHEKEHFDLVIAEHYGIDTLYAGYALKRYDPKIKFMPIFWDSLSGGFCPKFLPERFARHRKRVFERRIMEQADRAIVMESSLRHHLQTTAQYDYWGKMEVLNIPYLKRTESNNCDTPIELKREKLNVVFAGTLSQRSPSYLIELFNTLGKDVALTFICDVSYHYLIEREKKKFSGTLQYLPYMPYEKLIPYLHRADVLLNIGVREASAISGKIFDYMSYCKPIISSTFIDDEACIPYIERYPLGLVVDERLPLSTNSLILRNFLEKCKGQKLDYQMVAELFASCLPSAYVRVIDSL